MGKNFLRAVWDQNEDGWYFEISHDGNFESGCKPGALFDDPDETDKALREAAVQFAKWCGFSTKKLPPFEVINRK